MKFIKYKQVARITFYGFDDLYRDNNSSVSTEPLNSEYFIQNLNTGVQVGNNSNYTLTIKAHKSSVLRVYDREGSILGLPHEMYSNIKLDERELEDNELVDMYHQHDVMIYPTYGEGFGFIPFQALATGMPVISTHEWADYKKYLGPLKLNSTLIDSPWDIMHPGKVYKPDSNHLVSLIEDAAVNFKAYSGYYYAQSTEIPANSSFLFTQGSSNCSTLLVVVE